MKKNNFFACMPDDPMKQRRYINVINNRYICLNNDHKQLLSAMLTLLEEMRIDENALYAMAQGYSPDCSMVNKKWNNTYCKIQLSKFVAKKIINSGIFKK